MNTFQYQDMNILINKTFLPTICSIKYIQNLPLAVATINMAWLIIILVKHITFNFASYIITNVYDVTVVL